MKVVTLIASSMVARSASAKNFEAMSWASGLSKYDVDFSNKIHFPKASTWVFAMDEILCTDGDFIYVGTRNVPIYGGGNDGDQVIGYKKVDLVQPVVSTRQRCAAFGGGDNNCVKFETVVYRQTPARVINVIVRGTAQKDKGPEVLGTKSYTIPACGSLEPLPAKTKLGES
jgi:hypothetical protein